jgi:cbb3-type cytochrome oxidase maturation protein
MEIIFLLMAISFLIAVIFVVAFVWANKHSQFSNLSLEAWKILEKEKKSKET